MDSRSAPGRVVSSHLTDEAPDLGTRGGAARQGLPSPDEAKRAAVPGDHGVGLDQDQAVLPALPATQDQGPEGSVPACERQASLSGPFQDEDLVPEGQDLSREGSTRANASDEGAEEESDQAEHSEKIPEVSTHERNRGSLGAADGMLARHRS